MLVRLSRARDAPAVRAQRALLPLPTSRRPRRSRANRRRARGRTGLFRRGTPRLRLLRSDARHRRGRASGPMRRCEGMARHDVHPVARPDSGRKARRGIRDGESRGDGAPRRLARQGGRVVSRRRVAVGARHTRGETGRDGAIDTAQSSAARGCALSHARQGEFPCSAASPSHILDDAAWIRHIAAVTPPRPR